MNNSKNESSGKDYNYWRSLKELNNNPEAFDQKANEFMKGVTDDFEISGMSPVSRRKFLALLSASVAFAASSCTNYHSHGEIIPYNKKPEEVTPGIPNLYASTCTGCSNACGILIKTREGRPIKVDGNPDHPVNKGKICAIGQASVINLYDPNRLKTPVAISQEGNSSINWKTVDEGMIAELEKASSSGKQIAIISGRISSPSEKMVLDNFIAKYPTARVYSYELFENGVRNAAWNRSYAPGSFPLIQWDQAKVIVSLEGDFLANEGHAIENIQMFSKGRDGFLNKDFNRLYVVEATMTPTGMAADYRLRLKPDRQLDFVLSLMNEIGERTKSSIKAPSGTSSLKDFVKNENMLAGTVEHLVQDLIDNRGSAIVYAGSLLPEDVHVAVNALNEMLGNTRLYRTDQAEVLQIPFAQKQDLENLVGEMNKGNVQVIIHYDTNPIFDLPQDYGYADALKKVPFSIAMLEQENETSALCRYALPISHDFESWGDFNTRMGIFSLRQPVIYPLYSTRQKEAILLSWASGDSKFYKDTVYHDFIMNNWEKGLFASAKSPLDFRTFWLTALENGVVVLPENAPAPAGFKAASLSEIKPPSKAGRYTLYLKGNYSIGDGRYANNGFLQELPHPVTKVVWDNYAFISPKTAEEFGLEMNDMVEVKVGSRKQEFPVFIQPGTADGAVVVELGYGRRKAGEVGTGTGVNANILMSKDAPVTPFIYNDAQIRKASGAYKLVTTQEQHTIEDTRAKDAHKRRGIIREGTVDEYKKNPGFLEKEEREKISMNKNPEYLGVKWAMGIDLNKCVGCNACVTACDIENNVPVVGKEQVDKGRIMHWFRVDRYYSGTAEDPVSYTQPMLCQHCDTAPCENVCPVAATTHSPDGLNQMVYNRCVGTRYCSNNCPYKVRRFNFFNFRDHFADGYYLQEPVEMVYNPEVTVRSRGVMEKCTFCVQRIMQARENAIEENRELKGSDVQTACQQACPSEAIVFGDANDPDSIISKFRAHNLGYHVLVDLNTRPNITYLAKLRNIHPEV
ncbi:MAG: TAT-variant-translocated molybdopterin oxidoreductase [Ignavibacteria bacterium]|jgi:molybdopterin-containing oxidoreductase family iron-sulfur binding subunit|nr:TAT-variant-translocated molybdopterin oxidoreductase [Ignavibacteria bacterium]MCU7503919.1 TAT-variant-translocated molybdopterin oxidoreductase [Ignavibacteria bacterium]MCU7515860.1 TAT-variant-translocated molybdopterin oxidoreductase [Ignavibacteria bacterium]